MSNISGSMSAQDCRKAADYLEAELDKMRRREGYEVIREQVERLAKTVEAMRREADEKEGRV